MTTTQHTTQNHSSFTVGDRVKSTTKFPKVFRVGTVQESRDVGKKTERHFVRWDDDHAAHGFFTVPEVRVVRDGDEARAAAEAVAA